MTEQPQPESFLRSRRGKGILLMVAAVLLTVAAALLNQVTTPLLIAFILAYVAEPAIAALEKIHIRRWLAAALLYVVVFFIIAVSGMLLGPRLGSQAGQLYRYISQTAKEYGLRLSALDEAPDGGEATAEQLLSETLERNAEAVSETAAASQGETKNAWRLEGIRTLLDSGKTYIRENSDRIAARIGGFFLAVVRKVARGLTNIAGFVFKTLLVLVFAFFFMLNLQRIRVGIRQYIPSANRDLTLRIIGRIDLAVSNFFRGRLLVCLVAGIVSSIGFWISGLDYWLLLGLASGLLGFIPIIGVIITFIPACAFALLTAHPWMSVAGVVVTFLVVQWVVEPLAGTLVISREVKLHPVVIIVAFLIGGQLFGVFGVIISVPIAAVIKILGQELLLPSLKELSGPHNGR